MKINDYGERDYIAIPKFNVPEIPATFRCDEIQVTFRADLSFLREGVEVCAIELRPNCATGPDARAMAEYIAAAIAFAEEHRQFRARHNGIVRLA